MNLTGMRTLVEAEETCGADSIPVRFGGGPSVKFRQPYGRSGSSPRGHNFGACEEQPQREAENDVLPSAALQPVNLSADRS